ncbi:MAG: hypothetical protein WA359_08915 [Acidimicrobiales bacterium]
MSIADWIEATMAIETTTSFGTAVIVRRLFEDDGDDDELADISIALSEIRRRKSIAGGVYPFDVDEAGVIRNVLPARVYEFLLLCSLDDSPFRRAKDWASSSLHFERLARLALEGLYGIGTTALRFGAPVEGGRPTEFKDALKWLAAKIGCQIGRVNTASSGNDGGADIVVWRPFRDGKPVFPVTLAQCTVARHFENKGEDIRVNRWRAWILFNRDPQVALVVPFALGDTSGQWDTLDLDVDLVLDRFRLCELLEGADISSWNEVRAIEGWLDTQLGQLRYDS